MFRFSEANIVEKYRSETDDLTNLLTSSTPCYRRLYTMFKLLLILANVLLINNSLSMTLFLTLNELSISLHSSSLTIMAFSSIILRLLLVRIFSILRVGSPVSAIKSITLNY